MENFYLQLFIIFILKNPLFWFLIFLSFICTIFYKQIVGKAGEYHVKRELRKLPKSEYLTINDVMIKNKDITHQIDHIVISKYGIFVIETKQYNGYIVGNEYDKNWKQNKKYYINNPIHQNYGHVKALEEVLGLPENYFLSIVCISSTAKFKISSKSPVLHIYELNKYILSFNERYIDEYENIYNTLIKLNIVDKSERKAHIKYAKNIKNSKEINLETTCPRCGSKLVNRNGKYGEFVGCSNFPKCKYIKK